MIKLLILYTVLIPFSGSQIDTLPTIHTIKAWCIAVNEQNKDYRRELLEKDTTINSQDKIIKLKEEKEEAYKRKITAFEIQVLAYREVAIRKDTIINTKDVKIKVLKKRLWKERILFGSLLVLVLVLGSSP